MCGRQRAIDADGIDDGQGGDQDHQDGPPQHAGALPVVHHHAAPVSLPAFMTHTMAMTAVTAPGNRIVMPVIEK
jgi:hypothetical protein